MAAISRPSLIMPSASTVVAFTSPLIGPSTMDVISLMTSVKSLPSFAIRDGFVVTPQITYSLAVFGGPKVRYIWDRKSDIDFENFDQVNIRERLRPLNLSFTVGVSVTISRVFFDFRYDMGLHNISKSVTYDIPADNNAADENTKNEIRFHRRDNVLSFSFGVFF